MIRGSLFGHGSVTLPTPLVVWRTTTLVSVLRRGRITFLRTDHQCYSRIIVENTDFVADVVIMSSTSRRNADLTHDVAPSILAQSL
jgi:hypothetical protein